MIISAVRRLKIRTGLPTLLAAKAAAEETAIPEEYHRDLINLIEFISVEDNLD